MKTRIFSGIMLILVLFALLYFGGYVLLAALFLFSEIGLFEFNRAVSKQHRPYVWLGYAAVLVYYGLLAVRKEWIMEGNAGFLFLVILFLILMISTVSFYPERRYEDAFLTFGGVVYVAVLFSFVYFVRVRENGFYYTWFLFWAAWGSDTCAYFTGRALGKHKLVPKLSPNKTIEGAVGGVAGAMIICLVYGLIIRPYVGMSPATMCLLSLCIGFFGAILGQVGDLFSSSIKRFESIKDFGNLIPGHGGILDRFDSVLLTGTVVALALMAIV